MKRQGLNPVPRLAAARTRYPADFELAFLLGNGHFVSRDGQGIGPFEAARALRPENYAVWVNLGDRAGPQRSAGRGHRLLQKGHRTQPESSRGLERPGGHSQPQRKDYDGAIVCLRKAIELDPRLAEPHAGLGDSLKFKGHWDEAIAEYKKARELKPTLAWIVPAWARRCVARASGRGHRQLPEASNSIRRT